MAQDTFATFAAASSSNSAIEGDATDGSVSVAEGCALGNMNNAVRALAAACNLSFGDLPSGTSRPSYLASGKLWKDTTTATAPIIKYYDGSDDITLWTVNTTANTVSFNGAIANLVEDTTPQLGAALDLNGFAITFPGAAVTDVTGSDTLAVSGTAGTSGNISQWNADGDLVDASIATSAVVTLTGSQTLTNKTLTAPIIATISNTGTVTLPTATDTLVGRDTTDTLTNKTINLTSNTLASTVAQMNTALSDGNIAGQQTIWVPAGAMTTRTTNGAAAGTVETTTNKVMISTYDFDTATDEHVQFAVLMPKSWDEGTLVAQFVWSHASTTTNFGVRFFIQAVAFANDDAADTAFGTAVGHTADTGGTTNDIYITPETSAITVAGSPAAEEYVVFQVYRDVSDAGDTLAVDARLHGVKIHYTTNAPTDD